MTEQQQPPGLPAASVSDSRRRIGSLRGLGSGPPDDRAGGPILPVVVSYGGGLNSSAMLCGLIERRQRTPAAILFADTGAETPATYRWIERFSEWLTERGFPAVTTVRKVFKDYSTLEANCLHNKTLPSLAFGWRSCSQKWKARPQDEWIRAQGWDRVEKHIGYDAAEEHRVRSWVAEDKHLIRFPLIEWGWGRQECRSAIQRHGLTPPPKSSCFFCPALKVAEVLALKRCYPDLWERAVRMERVAREGGNLHTVKGLGRHWSFEEVVKQNEAQGKFWPEMELPCGCYDG